MYILKKTFEFTNILQEWDNEHSANGYDPTKLLEKMAEILEKETHVYMASDPGKKLSSYL